MVQSVFAIHVLGHESEPQTLYEEVEGVACVSDLSPEEAETDRVLGPTSQTALSTQRARKPSRDLRQKTRWVASEE